MEKKMGRPTTDPKDNYIGIRLSDEEINKIKFCTERMGTTKTGVIRAELNWFANR